MKKILPILAVLALAAAPAGAANFSVYGSMWDAKDVDNVGGGGAGLAWPLGEMLDIEARASYYEELQSEPFDDYLFEGDTPFEQSGLKVLPLEVGTRFNFNRDEGKVHPYLGAGLGYYALDSDVGNLDDEVGFYGSAGSSFGNGAGVEFFAEFNYRFVEGTVSDFGDLDDDGFDDEFDIDLGGPLGSVGVLWVW